MARTDSRPRRASPLNLPGAFELFRPSYEIIKRNFDVFMVLFSVGFLIALWDSIARYVDEKEQGRDWENILANGFFGPDIDSGIYKAGGLMFLFTILYAISYLLIQIAVLRSAQGHQIALKGLWTELTERWLWLKLIGANILLGASIVVGFILLIIPGVILLWRLFLVPYILIDQKTSIVEAFNKSWDMTRGFSGAIYPVILVTLLIAIINVVPLIGGLVSFLAASIYMIAPALRYEQIKKLNQSV